MPFEITQIDDRLRQASSMIAISRAIIQRQPPDRLYHYTNTNGLMGILTSSRLWATHFRYLNDSSEIDYGFSLFSKIVEERLIATENPIVSEFLSRTIRTANAFDGMFEAYIACFCESGDLLNQWRSYTDMAGGFSVAFKARELGMRNKVENPSQDFILRKVEYDPEIQNKLINEVLSSAISVLAESTARLSPEDANLAIARCCHFIQIEVAEYLLCFKHSAFESEREWRLCHIVTGLEQQHVSFRNGPYGITPYVCLDPSPIAGVNSNRLPIVAIRHGPTSNAQNVKFGLSKLVRQKGYAFVDISGTELPMRVNF